MAKPKINFNPKDFLLRKGEIVVMGAAGLCLFVLLIWGASKFASAEDPNKTARNLAQRADGVNTKIADKGPPGDADKQLIEVAEFITKKQKDERAGTRDFPTAGPVFDPTAAPSSKRDNPLVLNVEDYQVDLVRGAMPGFDIIDGDKGREIGMIVTKVKGKQDTERLQELGKLLKSAGKKGPGGVAVQPPKVAPPGGGFAGEGGVPGSPYGSSAGGGYDPNARRHEDKVLSYELLTDYDKKVAEGYAPAVTVIPVRLVTVHAVVPFKKQLMEASRALRIPIPAPVYGRELTDPMTGQKLIDPKTNLPLREVTNQAKIDEAMSALVAANGLPQYDGFEVQRREVRYDAAGKDLNPWKPVSANPKDTRDNYPFEDKYIDKIGTRKIGDHIDEGYLPAFLRPDMMLSMPLPLLAPELGVKYRVRFDKDGPTNDEKKDLEEVLRINTERKKFNAPREEENKKREQRGEEPLPLLPLLPTEFHPQYPGLRLKPILDNIRALERAERKGETASEAFKRLSGNQPRLSIYMPQANSLSGTGFDGGFGGVAPLGQPPKEGGKGPVGMPPGGPAGGGTGGPLGAGPAGGVLPEIENFLLRFIDSDVEPGRTYEYRIRLRLKNPNFGDRFKGEVSQDAFAGKEYEILYSKWRTLNTPITVPAESFVYAYDSKEYQTKTVEALKDTGKEGRERDNLLKLYQITKESGQYVFRDGLAAVQMATWMEAVRTEATGRREPVGSWVVTEMPVGRGEYIGRKQYVRLPLWSSEKRSYLFREVGEKLTFPKGSLVKSIDLPKGWLVDFSTNSVLVDFEGGRVKTTTKVSFDKEGNVVLNSNPQTVVEDVYTDLLILRGQDNKVVVRSSQRDGGDGLRKGILESWTGWQNRVKEDTASGDPKKSDFGPKGPPGGKGP